MAIRILPFWSEDPELWFMRIEAQFAAVRITADMIRFNNLVGSLDSQCLQYVRDLVKQPQAGNTYGAVKERLLAEFAQSDQRRIKSLITGMQLGDQKPSHLMRRIRQASDGLADEAYLKGMSLERLPPEVKAILATSRDDLDQLARVADSIMLALEPELRCDVANLRTRALEAVREQHSDRGVDSDLRSRVDDLTRKFDNFTADIGRRFDKLGNELRR